jgi:hypothetical protein
MIVRRTAPTIHGQAVSSDAPNSSLDMSCSPRSDTGASKKDISRRATPGARHRTCLQSGRDVLLAALSVGLCLTA